MPQNTYLWLTLILATAALVALALWLGRRIRISKGEDGFSIETEAAGDREADPLRINVAERLDLKNTEAGDVAGIKGGTDSPLPEIRHNIEVLKQAKVTDSKLGDLAGIKLDGGNQEQKG